MAKLDRRAVLAGLGGVAGLGLVDRASAQQQTYDINVGALFPMTGPNKALGENAEKAIRTALEVVHGDYDLDLPMARTDHLPALPNARLKYLLADHKGDPAVARAEAERLLASGKVVALIGAADERVTPAIIEVAEKARVPYLDADSASLSLRARQSAFAFRFAADEAARANSLFDFFEKMHEDRRGEVKTIALLHDKEPEDMFLAQLLRAIAAKRKLTIADTGPYVRGQIDATAANAQRLRTQADAILLLGAASDAENLVTQSGRGAPIICFPTRIQDRAVGTIADSGRGLIYLNGFTRDARDNDANIAAINTLYRSLAKKDLDELTALQFTAVLTLAFAINDARNASPAAIAQKLAAARFPGDRTVMPWEQFQFDATRQNIGAGVVVAQRQSEKSSTVFPPRFATSAVQWRA